MAKQIAAKCRQSASLIILAKDNSLPRKSFDYNALLFTRPSKSSFMPDSSVFPGGVCENADSSLQWLKHFNSFGFHTEELSALSKVRGVRPPIFRSNDNNMLLKEISLRITAIRETFEEVGVMLCRNRKSIGDAYSGYAKFDESFDRQHWQRIVHDDPNTFITMCQELDIVPDLWSLHEWSAWLTPSTFKTRFETAFFLVTLQDTPNLIVEKNEAIDYAWCTPLEYLMASLSKKLWLPPPQFYELSRCLHFKELEELRKFAANRAKEGVLLTLPVQYKCLNGTVHLLPGDDMYPTEPEAINKMIETGITIEDFRSGVKNLHRSEHLNQHQSKLQLNFDFENGQLPPLDPRTI